MDSKIWNLLAKSTPSAVIWPNLNLMGSRQNILMFCIWKRGEADQCQDSSVCYSQASYLFLQVPFTVPGKNKPKSCIWKLHRLKISFSSLFLTFSSVATMVVFRTMSAPRSPLSACTERLHVACSFSSKCKTTIPTSTNSWVSSDYMQTVPVHTPGKGIPYLWRKKWWGEQPVQSC